MKVYARYFSEDTPVKTFPIQQSMRKLFKVLLLIIAATIPFATVTAAGKSPQARYSTTKKKKSSGPKFIGTADNGFRFYNDHTIKAGGGYDGTWENRDGYMVYSMVSADCEEIGFIYQGTMYQLFCGSDIGMCDFVSFNSVTEMLQTKDYDGKLETQSFRTIAWNEYNTTSVSWKNTPGNHRIGKIIFPDNEYPETYIFGDGSCAGLEFVCQKGVGYCLFYGERGSSALLVNDYWIWPTVDEDDNPTVDESYNYVVIEGYYPDTKTITGFVWGENPDVKKTISITPYLIPQNKVNVTWFNNK